MVAGWCFCVGTGQLVLTSAFTQGLQKNHGHLPALAFSVLWQARVVPRACLALWWSLLGHVLSTHFTDEETPMAVALLIPAI